MTDTYPAPTLGNIIEWYYQQNPDASAGAPRSCSQCLVANWARDRIAPGTDSVWVAYTLWTETTGNLPINEPLQELITAFDKVKADTITFRDFSPIIEDLADTWDIPLPERSDQWLPEKN